MKKAAAADTSWENSAEWYDEHLKGADTYHERVVLPNLLRLLAVHKGERVLDLACGQGYVSAELAKLGAAVTGVDASPALIAKARVGGKGAAFTVGDAAKLGFKDGEFDAVVCVLALQNMEQLLPVFKEVRRVLKKGGRFLFVINHPAFRIPKRTHWGFDEKEGVQYRRVERYLSAEKIKIDMHPGGDHTSTLTFHRSLQDFMKALHGAGFAITRMEEWISHRKSEKGPRQSAEDIARGEFPLFLAVETR